MFKFIPFSIVCVLLQISLTHLTSASPQGYLSKAGDFWTTLGVVPVLIDAAPPETLIVCHAPCKFIQAKKFCLNIQVEYEGGLTVNGGNQLTPTQVQNKPVKIQWPFQDGDLFTLCLIGNILILFLLPLHYLCHTFTKQLLARS